MEKCEACKELSKVYDATQELLTAYFINKKKPGIQHFCLRKEIGDRNP